MKWIIMAILAACAATASAQTVASNPWERCTTVQVFGGAATASPNTTGTLGAAVGWDVTHHFEIEGMGAWLSQRRGTEAFAGDLRLLVNLSRPAAVVPYVGGGIGLYRHTFEPARADVPNFYGRRVGAATGTARMTYVDPTAVITGGANIYVATHLSIRPEVTLRFVNDESDTYLVKTMTFALVYHVERHVPRRNSLR